MSESREKEEESESSSENSSSDCFVISTEQYKNIYIQMASRYAQRVNEGTEMLLDENSLARKILMIATGKIAELEAKRGHHVFTRELVRTIGELTVRFIDLALKYDRTDNLLELFNEALQRILRFKCEEKLSSPCILEQYQAASEREGRESPRNTPLEFLPIRSTYQLKDWRPKSESPARSWHAQKAEQNEWGWMSEHSDLSHSENNAFLEKIERHHQE